MKLATSNRPKQSVPAEIVADLLSAIRNQFYPDATPKQWGQDSHFLRARVVMYPAAWLVGRGVTLPPARYKQIVLEVLNGIKIHGHTAQVTYWPRYLLHCLQQHFKHHAEEIYAEAKGVRVLAEAALHAAGVRPGAAPTVDPIRVIAEARQDLLNAARARKATKTAKPPTQPDLFD